MFDEWQNIMGIEIPLLLLIPTPLSRKPTTQYGGYIIPCSYGTSPLIFVPWHLKEMPDHIAVSCSLEIA